MQSPGFENLILKKPSLLPNTGPKPVWMHLMQNKGSANASGQSLRKKPQPEQTFLLEHSLTRMQEVQTFQK
ncbi:Rho Gtpase-Activating Protein 31 [Manis pentadactyla]|nr:Rho Gtpase-Activating Protein 31 [Manis pentadactyla]